MSARGYWQASCPGCGWVGPDRPEVSATVLEQVEHDAACTVVALDLFDGIDQ